MANTANPDQTAPRGTVWSWFKLFAIKAIKVYKQMKIELQIKGFNKVMLCYVVNELIVVHVLLQTKKEKIQNTKNLRTKHNIMINLLHSWLHKTVL